MRKRNIFKETNSGHLKWMWLQVCPQITHRFCPQSSLYQQSTCEDIETDALRVRRGFCTIYYAWLSSRTQIVNSLPCSHCFKEIGFLFFRIKWLFFFFLYLFSFFHFRRMKRKEKKGSLTCFDSPLPLSFESLCVCLRRGSEIMRDLNLVCQTITGGLFLETPRHIM